MNARPKAAFGSALEALGESVEEDPEKRAQGKSFGETFAKLPWSEAMDKLKPVLEKYVRYFEDHERKQPRLMGWPSPSTLLDTSVPCWSSPCARLKVSRITRLGRLSAYWTIRLWRRRPPDRLPVGRSLTPQNVVEGTADIDTELVSELWKEA